MIINVGDTIKANHGRSGEIINIGIAISHFAMLAVFNAFDKSNFSIFLAFGLLYRP